jgi:hypothetical protein
MTEPYAPPDPSDSPPFDGKQSEGQLFEFTV